MMPSVGPVDKKLRVVLDTNVVISALLFQGIPSRLVSLWQSDRFRILLSRPILEEYIKSFSYPKFNLTEIEVKAIIHEEILPFSESVTEISLQGIPFPRDPHDQKFLACAKSGKADYLISGDKDLLVLKIVGKIPIITPTEFLELI